MTTPKLKRQARALALATAMLGGFAATSLAEDARTVPAETKAAITQKLQSEGYEVRKIKREDGMVEVYALKDGQMLELYLDAAMKIVRVKQR